MKSPIIVLVEPSHPGNIGAVARAMKTMGHLKLRLVNPKQFPHETANIRASGAIDVLENAICYDSLQDAIADCNLVLGTSNRPRTLNWPVYNPSEAAAKVKTAAQCAIVFGRESTGLLNNEINLCNGQITIPTYNKYQSLNLSHAVQIITYAMASNTLLPDKKTYEYASNQESAYLKEHLIKTLPKLKHFHMPNPEHTINRLFCLINRSQPSKNELNLLRGILSAVDKIVKE